LKRGISDHMREDPYRMQRFRGIAFLGNYLPRNCGIATFTSDLSNAVSKQAGADQEVIVAAMNDIPEGYAYPEIVKFELRQDHQIDYSRAADFLNFSHIDVVSLQHEYGIFGGEEGSNVLTFLRDLARPVVVTCHTILKDPLPMQKEILCEIAAESEKLVVMSKLAFGFLEDAYGIHRDKIAYIPHGIHDVPFIDPNYYKDKFGVEGRKVLLTFGLLGPQKGIEYMIEALPEIVAKHSKTTYVVLGATHPYYLKKEGESYRLGLQRKVRELGLEDHVLFYPRFVELDELLEYLGATDIFITPYLILRQITSGALSYAMGTGKAVVSTPYWHAEELLAEGRGCLVPPRDPKALALEIISLLDDEVKRTAMRKRAYNHCRGMVWSAVARSYLELFDEVRRHVPKQFPLASAMRSPIAPTNLPTPKLDHVLRLTDETGPAHHARYSIPDWNYGYSLDDAASTLVASTKFFRIYGDEDAQKIAETCLALFQTLIGDNASPQISAGLDYARNKTGLATEDVIGKAIWALGYMVWQGPEHLEATAYDLFHQVLPAITMESPRAASYAVLGASNFLHKFPGASAIKRFLEVQITALERLVSQPDWYKTWESADWPIVAQAYSIVGQLLGDDNSRATAKRLIKENCEITSNGTVFVRQGDNPEGEELPVTCATFIEALCALYYDNRDPQLLMPIRAAVDWFLGANRLNKTVYNFATGGCHDAVTSAGINRNQGTEATVYCLMAFLSLNQVIGLEESLRDKETR
jgi:glycosyltransferase involved in cell wall biosynthesis